MRRIYTSVQNETQTKLGRAAAYIRKAMECLTDAYEDMEQEDDDQTEDDEEEKTPKNRRNRYM